MIRKLVTMAISTSYIIDQMYYQVIYFQVICDQSTIYEIYWKVLYLSKYNSKSNISQKTISQNILKNHIFDQSTFDLLAFYHFGTELGVSVKKVPLYVGKLYI